MLEIGAVVDAGSEQDDLRLGVRAGRQRAQDAGKFRGIVIDGEHFVLLKGFGEGARHDQAIFEDVGDAAGSADIVFENEKFAGGGIANQVDAADMGVNAVRDFEANHFAAEMTAGIDE